MALAAVQTGRPVRSQLDRDLDRSLTGKRHPCRAKFSVGHDRDGRLLAQDSPDGLKQRTGTQSPDTAFLRLVQTWGAVARPPR